MNKDKPCFTIQKAELNSVERDELIEKVMLRFKNVKLDPGNQERAGLRLSLEHEGRRDTLGEYRRGRIPEHALVKDVDIGESLAFDLTAHKSRFVSRPSSGPIKIKQQVGFSIDLIDSLEASFAWKDAELNVYYAD